jgi:hypothetical protein
MEAVRKQTTRASPSWPVIDPSATFRQWWAGHHVVFKRRGARSC